MTHTSTSPNYQIIASLDVGLRQVELEGFEFVQSVRSRRRMSMRRAIMVPTRCCSQYFKVLTSADMVPEAHRESPVIQILLRAGDQGWDDYLGQLVEAMNLCWTPAA